MTIDIDAHGELQDEGCRGPCSGESEIVVFEILWYCWALEAVLKVVRIDTCYDHADEVVEHDSTMVSPVSRQNPAGGSRARSPIAVDSKDNSTIEAHAIRFNFYDQNRLIK